MQGKPVELLRAVLAAIGPANSAVPAVRAAYDFLESLDEPAPVDVPPGLVEAVANDCAVELLDALGKCSICGGAGFIEYGPGDYRDCGACGD